MAVTKIWAIHDSLNRVTDYCSNPEKTRMTDLEQVLMYASDAEKTKEAGEESFAVTGINCKAETLPITLTSPSSPARSRQSDATGSVWNWPAAYGAMSIRCWWRPISTPGPITTTS